MKTYREKIVKYGAGLALCGALSLLGYSVANAAPVGSVIPAVYNQQVGPNVKFQNAWYYYYNRPYYHHRYYYWHYRPYWRHRYYYRYY